MKKSLRFFFVAALAMMSMSTMAQTTVTFDAATDKGTKTASDPGEDQITKDGVTIAVSNGCMNLTDQYRCYKGATFTVTSTAGNITKVEISCTAEGDAKYGPGCFTDATAGTYAYEGKVGTWTGDAASFSMTSSTNQVRMNTVVVTLAGGSTEGGAGVWDFTVLPTQKIDGTGNLETNAADGVFVEDGGAAWQQAYNKAGLTDGTEFTCADGVVFEPTKGLKWSALENNKMVFYRNYPAEYGGKHLAFNKAAEVMIPAKAGQVIEMVLASSKSGGTTKKITSQDVVETFDDGGGIKIEFPTAYEYNTYTLTAKVDNPYLAFESTFCIQKITVKDAGETPVEGGVIFSWEGGEAGATVTGGTATYMSGPEGTDRVNYKNADYYTLSINGKKGNMGTEASNNGGYIQIDLNQELAADDAIEMTGYINKNEAGKEASIFFQFEKGEGVDDPYIYGDADNIDPTVGGKISTHELKVPADAAGSKNFKMSRNKAGTNVFLTKLVITRGGASGISDVKVVRVADGAIYNLAGQKVGKDYKGIVIMNGRKFMQK